MWKFIIECWDGNRYRKIGEYKDLERAEIMFNKGYFRKHTRRLIVIKSRIIKRQKGTNA